ncbi:MAG: ATP-binding cassette domain-containing protein [Propionibacteriaceae bacterium]|nr:ATP-binding cassette domain-containing protein [Propionibacteriaceae bacterium]
MASIDEDSVVTLDNVTRTFKVAERTVGFGDTVRGFFHRKYTQIPAISNVAFTACSGEILGVLGPNGSGKTTTLKCISGLLTPTSGKVDVMGFTPHERDPEFLRRIGFIMGQRSQLHPDVSVFDSLQLRKVIYSLSDDDYQASLNELTELLGLAEFGDAPVRQLSLGQRMRCEFAAALLHRPSLVLLDEPTIGLDFDAQASIRRFVEGYVRAHHATVLLTSHYLADIEALAGRVIVMAKGHIAFTGSLAELRHMDGGHQLITIQYTEVRPDFSQFSWEDKVTEPKPGEIHLEVLRDEAPHILAQVGALSGVSALSLSDPPLETALSQIYATVSSEADAEQIP